MHGPATFRFSSICLVLAALALSCMPTMAASPAAKRPSPPSLVQAFHAAEANLRLIPGGDIESGFRPVWTAVADLDGDGRAEVVCFYTSDYSGGSFAQATLLR